MSKYELPSGEASVEKTASMLGERDYTYPLSKKDITKALTEALDELWLKQNLINEFDEKLDQALDMLDIRSRDFLFAEWEALKDNDSNDRKV
jgi:hypothetical protein